MLKDYDVNYHIHLHKGLLNEDNIKKILENNNKKLLKSISLVDNFKKTTTEYIEAGRNYYDYNFTTTIVLKNNNADDLDTYFIFEENNKTEYDYLIIKLDKKETIYCNEDTFIKEIADKINNCQYYYKLSTLVCIETTIFVIMFSEINKNPNTDLENSLNSLINLNN